MISASKPLWQQVTALVSLGASGTITGFSFVPAASADLTSPTSMPIRLMALERSVQAAPADDATLRSAIVNVANYYLRMAQGKTPAEMEAIIWQHDSVDGVDHGASCAAFASLTLELASHVVGQQSWVTGGTSYPWPLHKWADVRVDPNPDSPDIISVLRDAQAHARWHPLGDGYDPQPGDWVLFDGHVEVVTKYADGVLDTIGGDSLPNFSVNAHEYGGSLSAHGIAGFVNNGYLPAATTAAAGHGHAGVHHEAGHATPAVAASGAPATEAADPTIPGAPAAPAVPGAAGVGAAGVGAAGVGATGRGTTDRGATASAIPAAASENGAPAIPGMATTNTRPDHTGMAHARQQLRARQPASPSSARRSQPTAGRANGRRANGSDAKPATPAGHADRRPGNGASVPGANTQPATPSGQANSLRGSSASVPGMVVAGPAGSGSAATTAPSAASASAIPGLPASSPAAHPARRQVTAPAASPGASARSATNSQQTFIDEVASGAMATQRRYGVPAAVTIAQAIDESGWGQSELAVNGHNLFGIKGTGPAGSELMPTQEYENGRWVTIQAAFRAYHNFAESIEDHGELLATSGYYTQAMANRANPDAFANALTGVYATNPHYGEDLIQIMQRFNLYRYDAAGTGASGTPAARHSSHAPAGDAASGGPQSGSGTATAARPAPRPARTPAPAPAPAPAPGSKQEPSPSPQPTRTPEPARTTQPTHTPGPAPTSQPTHTSQPEPAHRRTRTRHAARTPDPAPAVTAPSTGPRGSDPTADVPGLTPVVPQPKQTAAVTTADPITLSFSYQHLSAAMPAHAGRGTAVGAARSAVTAPTAPASTRRATVVDAMRSAITPAAPVSGTTRATRADQAEPPRPAFYHPHLPAPVKEAFVAMAKAPIIGMELVYRDVAGHIGIPWELLAACDWMQCQARPRFSPVHGEKLGSVNPDGTVYRTKSEALEQCAYDLVELTEEIYGIDVTARPYLSVTDLANVFAAFRWGGLLKLHNTSAMEFPYSVAGLTTQLMNMRWPNIDESKTPDKPGGRFRKPFGAVPLVLSLQYPATV